MSHSSIAVPMLGTGAHQYAKQSVVKDIVRSIKHFDTQFLSQPLKKVFLVVKENDNESLLATQSHFLYNTSVPVDSESVEVTFLGIRSEDLTNAASILAKSFYEHTSNEPGNCSFFKISLNVI